MNITKVYLLNVPLENDYKNTLYFTNKDNQRSYFESRIVKSYTDFSYQRKDSFIRVPDHFDTLMSQGVNYVMYQNSAYSNKWFYAFITDLKYVDDGRTDVFIETDSLQTWFFDITIKPSFVEREHVDNDTIGIHTVPEQLEHGEYIINTINKNKDLIDPVVVMASTIDPSLDSEGNHVGGSVAGGTYNGVMSGYKYYTFTRSMDSQLTRVLKALAKDGKVDSVGAIFLAPRKLVNIGDYENYLDFDNAMVNESIEPTTFGWGEGEGTQDGTIKKLTNLNGHTPRNKKLLTYPYCYLAMTNNNGGNAIYKYELFNSTECNFNITGVITPSMDIICTPRNYNGSGELVPNYHESLTCGKFPICGWSNDAYTNWLTQNGINIATNLLGSTLQVGMGATSFINPLPGDEIGGAMAIAGGVTSIANTVGEVYKHHLVPMQAEGNVNCGNVQFSNLNTTFTAYGMSIRKEYAEIIDKYFDMFGYKVNMVKTPNKAHRSRWWYTKTFDVNIDGAIPNKDMQIIKNCYNNGITFWRNASEIQNYELSNNIAITE